MKVLVLVGLFFGPLVMASGWDCQGSLYTAKVRNSTTATRTPALFLVTYKGTTHMRATPPFIKKQNLVSGVRYIADDGAELRYTLFIPYNEARNEGLKKGDRLPGVLTQNFDGVQTQIPVSCFRYLKNK